MDNLAKSGDEIRLNEKIKISKSVAIIGGRMIDPEKGKIIDWLIMHYITIKRKLQSL